MSATLHALASPFIRNRGNTTAAQMAASLIWQHASNARLLLAIDDTHGAAAEVLALTLLNFDEIDMPLRLCVESFRSTQATDLYARWSNAIAAQNQRHQQPAFED